MGELCALCPACRRLLDGDLVASKCNHVFHRKCLSEALEACPKCNQQEVWKAPLDLYGVCFDESGDPGAAAVAAALFAGGTCGGNAEEGEAAKVIAEVCALRDDIRKRQRELEDLNERVAEARAQAEKQLGKLRTAERAASKRHSDLSQLESDIAKFNQEHASLTAQMDQIRQRDTVLEYLEVLRGRSEADALMFLTKMVSMVSEPWKVLVEVARLRDDSRAKLDKWKKDSVVAVRREREARAVIADRERKVAQLQKELEKARGGQQAPSRAKAMKRPRLLP